MKRIFVCWFVPLVCLVCSVSAQPVSDIVVSPSIGTPQLYPAGNQAGYPIIRLNSTDQLELSFDDLGADVKAYSYTYHM